MRVLGEAAERDAAFSLTGRSPSHLRDHRLDMGDRRFRRDAVAEVEDQRTVAERIEYSVDPGLQRIAAGDETLRIEIALDRAFLLQTPRLT